MAVLLIALRGILNQAAMPACVRMSGQPTGIHTGLAQGRRYSQRESRS